jgi:hypothetical protein
VAIRQSLAMIVPYRRIAAAQSFAIAKFVFRNYGTVQNEVNFSIPLLGGIKVGYYYWFSILIKKTLKHVQADMYH